MRNRGVLNLFAFVAVVLVMTCCSPVYSPYVYDRTAEIKTETLSIIGKAKEPYDKHKSKVDELQSDIASLQMQEKLRKRNKIKQKQWEMQTDTAGYLLYGVLSKWKKDTVLNETFISLQKKLIGEAFDLMQETEKEYFNK